MTRTALKLNYAQSTVTKHLQLLEDEMGAPLFERQDGHRVLSPMGEILYKHSKVVLGEMFQISRDIVSLKNEGTLLRVGAMDQYCCDFFLPQVRTCVARHQGVVIEMFAVSNDEAFSLALSRDLDFSIAVGKQGSRDLAERVIDYEDLVLFASKKIVDDAGSLEQCLERHPVLLDRRANYIYYGFLKQGVSFPRMVQCNSDETVKRGVLEHAFLGLIGTGRIRDEIASGKVAILHVYSSHVPVKLFAHKADMDSPLFKYFFKLFQPISVGSKARADVAPRF